LGHPSSLGVCALTLPTGSPLVSTARPSFLLMRLFVSFSRRLVPDERTPSAPAPGPVCLWDTGSGCRARLVGLEGVHSLPTAAAECPSYVGPASYEYALYIYCSRSIHTVYCVLRRQGRPGAIEPDGGAPRKGKKVGGWIASAQNRWRSFCCRCCSRLIRTMDAVVSVGGAHDKPCGVSTTPRGAFSGAEWLSGRVDGLLQPRPPTEGSWGAPLAVGFGGPPASSVGHGGRHVPDPTAERKFAVNRRVSPSS